MVMNKVKKNTALRIKLTTNTVITSTHCFQCVQGDIMCFILYMRGQDNY